MTTTSTGFITIIAENTFTGAVDIQGDFNVSVADPGTGTVVLQRRFDEGDWLDVKNYTTQAEERGREPENNVQYRIGVKTSNFDASVVVRVSS